eukprot:TRINITY_DN20605_c0_g4_i1.p2 TRINITY_DN20605_c0_g4~~TRINITY_DN20605_c0_g4_i1.p2  ORF type:complete len:141 (-),score=13.42 TRINITY_DN20605_c0_g4_i1:276-698(-)
MFAVESWILFLAFQEPPREWILWRRFGDDLHLTVRSKRLGKGDALGRPEEDVGDKAQQLKDGCTLVNSGCGCTGGHCRDFLNLLLRVCIAVVLQSDHLTMPVIKGLVGVRVRVGAEAGDPLAANLHMLLVVRQCDKTSVT